MFALEILGDDDIIDTAVDGARWEASFIGALPGGHESIAEAASNRHAALADAIFELEKTCEAFDSVDVSARAAELALRRRVGFLTLLARTLGDVSAFAESAECLELFAPNSPLMPYLGSVYLWTSEVTEALADLAAELNVLQPNWAAFRERLSDVAWVHYSAAAEKARLSERGLVLPAELYDALEDLALILVSFKHRLDEPLG